MKSKKGIYGPSWKTTELILIILGALLVILVVWLFSSGAKETALDNLCTFSSQGRSFVSLGLVKFFPEMCEPRPLLIEASNWDKCPNAEKEKESKPNAPEPKQACAREQILEAIRRCWFMRGRGVLNPGDLECFYFKVTNKGEQAGGTDVAGQIDLATLAKAYIYKEENGNQISYAKVIPIDKTNLIVDCDPDNSLIGEENCWIKSGVDWTICFDDCSTGDKLELVKGIGTCPWWCI